MSRFGASALGAFVLALLWNCSMAQYNNAPPTYSVTMVTLNTTTLSIAIGDSSQLTATVYPTNATNKSVTWSSSNPMVATVSSGGLVSWVGGGNAIITVTTVDGGKKSSCSITTATPVAGVSLNTLSLSLFIGDSSQLTATVSPSNATNKSVTWSSSDESVATVSNGLVNAVGTGSAIIKATTIEGGKTATCTTVVGGYHVLPSDGSWISGNLSVSRSALWFEATVEGGETYMLNWDDFFEGSDVYSLGVWVSAFQSDRTTTYFTMAASGYYTPKFIDVPVGQNLVYVKVLAYYNGSSVGTFGLKLTLISAGMGGATVTIQ